MQRKRGPRAPPGTEDQSSHMVGTSPPHTLQSARVSVGTKIVVMPRGKDVPKMVGRVAAAPRLAVNTPDRY